jgi:two-component system sensor histidine kinase KdpD
VGFLTAVTHDLRTPLATIKAATSVLLTSDERFEPEARRDLLGAAYTEATRLERLVTNVIELSRVRSGALAPMPVVTTVPDLARAAVSRLGALGEDREIRVDLDPSLPAVVVDALQLEIVLGNVVENAVRHDPGDGPLEITAHAAAGHVTLGVVDHGPGIPEPDRERVFEEFVRLDAGGTTPGSGLGLAIVRALTEANGGEVRCRETIGGGATFEITLPTARDGT